MHSTQHSLLVGLLVLGTGLEIVAQSTATVTCALDGFTAVVGSCYLDGDPGRSSWEEAKKYCLRKGAHLPYVNSGEESRYLVDMASSTNIPIWLGLRVTEDSEKSALRWGDGSPVDADLWIQFNPDRTYACAALRKTDERFELADCSDFNHRICESEPDTPGNRELTTPTEAKSSKAETTLDDTIPKMTTTETTETLDMGTSPQTAASDTATMPEATATNFPESSYAVSQNNALKQCVTLDCLKELIQQDPTNEAQLTKVVEVSTDLLGGDNLTPTGMPVDDSARVTEVIEFLDDTFSLVLSNFGANKSTVSVTSRNIAFEAQTFSSECGSISTSLGDGARNDFSICTESGKGGHFGVGMSCVPDSSIQFPLDADEPDAPASLLASCVVTLNLVEEGIGSTTADRVRNVTMTIAKTEEGAEDDRLICAYWRKLYANESEGSWSEDGLRVVGSNVSHVVCSSDHLTNFAILVRVVPNKQPLSQTHDTILEVLSIAGGAISVTCLSITLVLYIWLKVYRSQTLVIHANLAVSILVSQVIFLVGKDAIESKGVCKLVAALLHYSLLSSFSWMMLEGANLYLKSTSIFRTNIQVWLLFVLGWVSPLPIVGVSLGVRFNDYTSAHSCWLNNENGLIWAFVGPVIIVTLLNLCVLLKVIHVFLSLEAMADKPRAKRIKAGARAVLLLTPLLGITWLIGLFVNVDGADLVVSYLFVILSSSQGVCIFLLHCALNEEVGKAFKLKRDKLRKLHSSKIHPNQGRTSKTTDDSTRSKQEKKAVTWGPCLSTDKTGFHSDSTKRSEVHHDSTKC